MSRNQIRGAAVIAAAILLAVFANPSSVPVDRAGEHGSFKTLTERLDK